MQMEAITRCMLSLGGAGMAAALVLSSQPAQACGGLFCSASQPVNQAAERIIFVKNGDGSVSAVVEIQYEGPSEKFAWLLPVPGTPKFAVSSKQALDRLQGQTNPVYRLTPRSQCSEGRLAVPGAAASSAPGGDPAPNAGVTVEAAGTVGPYDYKVISLDPMLSDPADVAVMWLRDNMYDLPSIGPDVLRPYLEGGMNLLAIKLNLFEDETERVAFTDIEREVDIPAKDSRQLIQDLIWYAGLGTIVVEGVVDGRRSKSRYVIGRPLNQLIRKGAVVFTLERVSSQRRQNNL